MYNKVTTASWNYYSNTSSKWTKAITYTTTKPYDFLFCYNGVSGIYNPIGEIVYEGDSYWNTACLFNVPAGASITFRFSVSRQQDNSDSPYSMTSIILGN